MERELGDGQGGEAGVVDEVPAAGGRGLEGTPRRRPPPRRQGRRLRRSPHSPRRVLFHPGQRILAPFLLMSGSALPYMSGC